MVSAVGSQSSKEAHGQVMQWFRPTELLVSEGDGCCDRSHRNIDEIKATADFLPTRKLLLISKNLDLLTPWGILLTAACSTG